MNRTQVTAIALALTALTSQAFAAKTVDQVEAERQEAVRTGNVASSIDGTGNAKLNEVFVGQYPTSAKVAGKTREQVEQERQIAVRSGALNFYPVY